VPVCLNCGKAIEPGGKYCEGCGPDRPDGALPIADFTARGAYKPPSRGYNRMMLITMFVLAVVMVAITVGLVLSVPDNPSYIKKAQAAVCRSHQRDIQRAIDGYKSANGKLPPAGRVSADNPLIVDRYLESPPECPSTHHFYIVESEDGTETVRCDSGLPGHKI
jgi:hypothetical protein